MGPRIGRAIGQGFLVANRSWAGIGFVAGCWLVVFLLVIAGLALTNPPRELVQVPAGIQGIATPEPGAGTAPPTTPAAAPQDQTAQAQTNREEAATRERLVGEWIARAWPILLVCFLLFLAASLWITGGQIAYLARRVTTQHASLAEFWTAGTQAFGALLGSTLLSLLAGAVLLLIGVLLRWLFSTLSGTPAWLRGGFGWGLGLGGLAALIWLGVRLAFWFIAIVVERIGPIAGLKASFRSTRGRWWRAGGLVAGLSLIFYAVALAFGLVEALGNAAGGAAAVVIGILSNILGTVANLYVGFAMLAAYLRFYEDTKAPAGSAPVA